MTKSPRPRRRGLLATVVLTGTVLGACVSIPTYNSTPLKKAELLAELPAAYDTPDGMCLLPNGEVILAVPNVNSWLAATDKSKQDPPPVLVKIPTSAGATACRPPG